jgi:hypothetical protein
MKKKRKKNQNVATYILKTDNPKLFWLYTFGNSNAIVLSRLKLTALRLGK